MAGPSPTTFALPPPPSTLTTLTTSQTLTASNSEPSSATSASASSAGDAQDDGAQHISSSVPTAVAVSTVLGVAALVIIIWILRQWNSRRRRRRPPPPAPLDLPQDKPQMVDLPSHVFQQFTVPLSPPEPTVPRTKPTLPLIDTTIAENSVPAAERAKHLSAGSNVRRHSDLSSRWKLDKHLRYPSPTLSAVSYAESKFSTGTAKLVPINKYRSSIPIPGGLSANKAKSGLAMAVTNVAAEEIVESTPRASYASGDGRGRGPRVDDRWSWTNSQAPPTPRLAIPLSPPSRSPSPNPDRSSRSSIPSLRRISNWVKGQQIGGEHDQIAEVETPRTAERRTRRRSSIIPVRLSISHEKQLDIDVAPPPAALRWPAITRHSRFSSMSSMWWTNLSSPLSPKSPKDALDTGDR